jgi:hypothetical protein
MSYLNKVSIVLSAAREPTSEVNCESMLKKLRAVRFILRFLGQVKNKTKQGRGSKLAKPVKESRQTNQ